MSGTEYDTPFFRLECPKVHKACQSCSRCFVPLSQCAGCRVAFYCSRDCQKVDWTKHKTVCKSISNTLMNYQKEEDELKHCDKNIEGVRINYFEHPHYRVTFWKTRETVPFCKALGARVYAYSDCNTDAAIKEAIHLGFKLLYHQRSDGFGMRQILPPLLIRMRMYQELFDLVKWYEEYPGLNHDWGSASVPFLSYWKQDRSQLVKFAKYSDLTFIISDTLQKHQLLLVCKDKEAFYSVILASKHAKTRNALRLLQGDRVIFERIYSYLVGNQLAGVSCKDPKVLDIKIKRVMKQAELTNERVWKAFINPKPITTQPAPSSIAPGGASEMYEILKFYKCVFPHIPKTLQYIHRYCKKEHGALDYDYKFNAVNFMTFSANK